MPNIKINIQTSNQATPPLGEYGDMWIDKRGTMFTADESGNAISAITTLVHSRSGTVHTLTGVVPASGLVTVRFKAVANFVENDSFRIGTTATGYITYTAKPTGEETKLPDKAFIANDIVTAEVDIGAKKINFKIGGSGGLPKDWQDIRTAEAGENIAKGDAIAMTKEASIESGELAYANVITTDSTEGCFGILRQVTSPFKIANDNNFLGAMGKTTFELRKLQAGKYVNVTLHSSLITLVGSNVFFDFSFDSKTLIIVTNGGAASSKVYVVDLYNPTATPKQLNLTIQYANIRNVCCYNTQRKVLICTFYSGFYFYTYDMDTLQQVSGIKDGFILSATIGQPYGTDFSKNDECIYFPIGDTVQRMTALKTTSVAGTYGYLCVSPTNKFVVVAQSVIYKETGIELVKLPNPAVPIPPSTHGFSNFTQDEKYYITSNLNIYKVEGETFIKLPKGSEIIGNGSSYYACSQDYCFAMGQGNFNANSTEKKYLAGFTLNTKALINKLTPENASLVVSKKVNGGLGISEQVATKGQQCKVNLFKKQNQALGQTI